MYLVADILGPRLKAGIGRNVIIWTGTHETCSIRSTVGITYKRPFKDSSVLLPVECRVKRGIQKRQWVPNAALLKLSIAHTLSMNRLPNSCLRCCNGDARVASLTIVAVKKSFLFRSGR